MSKINIAGELAQFLADEGLGIPGASLFLGEWQAETGSGLLIVETGGPRTDLFGAGNLTFQIASRGADYDEARALIWPVYEVLNDRPAPFEFVSGGHKICRCQAVQAPFYLSKDARQQAYFISNYQILPGI